MAEPSYSDKEGTNLPSLSSALNFAIEEVSSSPLKATKSLTTLLERTSSLQLFSKNETLQDVATSHIPLLSIEHHLALSLIASPTSSSIDRHVNVVRAVDLFHSFLRKLDNMDALKPDIQKEYHHVLDMDDNDNEEEMNESMSRMHKSQHLGESREQKIARFKLKRAAEEEVSRLRALHDRRTRLSAEPEEEIDGYDDDGIKRTYNIAGLHRCSVEAIDEILTALREIEMLKMAVQMERQREVMDKYTGAKVSKGILIRFYFSICYTWYAKF